MYKQKTFKNISGCPDQCSHFRTLVMPRLRLSFTATNKHQEANIQLEEISHLYLNASADDGTSIITGVSSICVTFNIKGIRFYLSNFHFHLWLLNTAHDKVC